MNLFSKFIRRIPPFRNLYRRIDALKKENSTLKKTVAGMEEELNRLSKQINGLLSSQQELEAAVKTLGDATAANANSCQAAAEQAQRNCDALREELTAERKSAVEQAQRDCGVLRNELTALKNVTADRDKLYQKQLSAKISSTRRDMMAEMNYLYYKGLHPDQYADALKEWYYQRTGQVLNLEHPRTYTEKIQWLKLYDNTPLKGELSDKYLVRDYVREKIGEEYLVPLLGVWDRVDDIPFDDLPQQYALKATHGSGWNIIVKDKALLNVEDTKRKLNKWMRTNFAYHTMELHYKTVQPRIIAEKYIENENGDINDYKVLCFDGKAKYILFLTGRQTCLKKAVYDTSWNLMPFLDSGTRLEQEVPKPAHLAELISLAEKLAAGFAHVRVDFYCLNDGAIKFGEMTFTPASGQYMWEPAEYERKLGDMIHLPCDEREAQ